jgi:hypothetical protein
VFLIFSNIAVASQTHGLNNLALRRAFKNVSTVPRARSRAPLDPLVSVPFAKWPPPRSIKWTSYEGGQLSHLITHFQTFVSTAKTEGATTTEFSYNKLEEPLWLDELVGGFENQSDAMFNDMDPEASIIAAEGKN